jgi:hypothetical protein
MRGPSGFWSLSRKPLRLRTQKSPADPPSRPRLHLKTSRAVPRSPDRDLQSPLAVGPPRRAARRLCADFEPTITRTPPPPRRAACAFGAHPSLLRISGLRTSKPPRRHGRAKSKSPRLFRPCIGCQGARSTAPLATNTAAPHRLRCPAGWNQISGKAVRGSEIPEPGHPGRPAPKLIAGTARQG